MNLTWKRRDCQCKLFWLWTMPLVTQKSLRKNWRINLLSWKLSFCLPTLSPFWQPMDQQTISVFRKLCTKNFFRKCFDTCYGSTGIRLNDKWSGFTEVSECRLEKAVLSLYPRILQFPTCQMLGNPGARSWKGHWRVIVSVRNNTHMKSQ